MKSFLFSPTKSIVFHAGAVREIDRLAGAVLGPLVLVITDPGLCDPRLVNPAINALVGFGRTSSLDVAKVAAQVLGTDRPLEAAWGVDKATGPQ